MAPRGDPAERPVRLRAAEEVLAVLRGGDESIADRTNGKSFGP